MQTTTDLRRFLPNFCVCSCAGMLLSAVLQCSKYNTLIRYYVFIHYAFICVTLRGIVQICVFPCYWVQLQYNNMLQYIAHIFLVVRPPDDDNPRYSGCHWRHWGTISTIFLVPARAGSFGDAIGKPWCTVPWTKSTIYAYTSISLLTK